MACMAKEVRMRYEKTKIYFDGSHYVGIPHTTADRRYRPKAKEEEFDEDGNKIKDPFAGKIWTEMTAEDLMFFPDGQQENSTAVESDSDDGIPEAGKPEKPLRKRVTKGSEFSRLYEESRTMKKGERRQCLFENMRKYFRSDTDAKSYVEKKLQDRHRAMIARRIRFTRKAHLNDFNYFVTVTYLYGQYFDYVFVVT